MKPEDLLEGQGRPLLARLADARAMEEEAQELLVRCAEVRAELENLLEVQRARTREPAPGSNELVAVRGLGEDVRDAVIRFSGAFTVSELCAEVGASPKEVKKFLEPMILGGVVEDTGTKFAGKTIFQYVPPPAGTTQGRVKRPPPEKVVDPAYTEARATGEPVRVAAMARLTRKQRSGSVQVQKHRNRDRAWERQQEANAERAQRAREKAEKDFEKLRKMRNGK